jgi:hypothetical protein
VVTMRLHAFFTGFCGTAILVLGAACSGTHDVRQAGDTGGCGATATGGSSGATSTGGTGGTSTGGKGGASTAGAGGGGGTAGTGGDAFLDFYRELLRAQCEFDERCASTNGRAYVNLEACSTYTDYFLEILEVVLEEDDSLFSYYTIKPGDHRACALSIYPLGTCERPLGNALSPECEAVVEYGDTTALGGVCYSDAAATGLCEPGSTCRIENGCGICEVSRDLPDGSACEIFTECMSESCIDGFCANPKPRGASCTSDPECRGYLRCRGADGATVCDDAAGVGDSCEYNSNCVNGLSCLGEPLVCTLDAANGATCDRAGTASCVALCVFAAPDAATGQCGVALPRAGEPCTYSGTLASCSDGYAKRTVNADGVDTACVCGPREPAGAPCRASADCESYRCVGASFIDPTVLGVCDPPSQNGGDCTSSLHCESGFCGEDLLCAAPPICG